MSAIDHALTLRRMADKDITALKAMTDVEVFADEIFGFHAAVQFRYEPQEELISRIDRPALLTDVEGLRQTVEKVLSRL